MLAVGLSAELFMQTIDAGTLDDIGQRISIAAINSPSAVTVAGDSDALDEIARQLDEREIFNRFLTGKVPYHTHFMDAIKGDLYSAFEGLSPDAATIPLYSTVTGEQLEGYADGAAYWWQNTRATVLFEPAVRRMIDDGYTRFVELGPHPVLAASLLEIAGTHQTDVLVAAAQRRDEDDSRTLMTCVGALHCHGHPIAWDAFYPRRAARLLKLPLYPWQSKRFWNETEEAAEDLHYHPVHPLLGQPVSGIHSTWEVELSIASLPFLADHQVQGSTLVPGAMYIEMALAAAQAIYGSVDYSVDDLMLRRPLILDDTCDPVLRTTLNRDAGTLEFAAFTATAGGDVKWTITATAELNTLVAPSDRAENQRAEPVTTIDRDEFYARAHAVGFAYGDAFQTITDIRSGDGWAEADLATPAQLIDELDRYRFHPALIDGAFQTLIGTTLLGHDADDSPYLPTRIRKSAIYCAPEKNMTAHVRVVSTTTDEIESDITITGDDGQTLAVFTGFILQSLNASSRMTPERVDKGLYEVQWVDHSEIEHDVRDTAIQPGNSSWLVFIDKIGTGTAVAEQLRRSGHRVRTVVHRPVTALTEVDGGYAMNAEQPRHLHQLIETHVDNEGDLAGVVNCWPLDICADAGSSEINDRTGVFTILHLVKAIADHDAVRPRLYVITANAQSAPGTQALAVDQAAIWGLGRVIGHQEFVDRWGGLIDIDDADDPAETASRVCEHILADEPDDQIAIRGRTTFVPRLRPSTSLTQAFPTKLTPNATYVVTGGGGALGRIVATYLAEHGARHIALLCRSEIPPRSQWASLSDDHRHYATVDTMRKIEELGARVTTASVDITDADQMTMWLSRHIREGGRPVRGIVHAAGSVDDRLLVNMTETDFTTVMAPKIRGARVLHEAFHDHDLQFFVMFGSAGSVIASPGQGNYAAANAFLDAFAHYRQAQGLPALTIGWGPWSVGMVEELKLEKMYTQRGIELITPAAGARILDRLINQNTANIIAISADWMRARRAGLGGQLPPMFSELGTAETPLDAGDSESSLLDFLSACPEANRLDVVVGHVQHIAAAVFELAVTDIGPDDALDDIGLDSMMAMDFRLRVNAMFAIDLPLLELLRGVTVSSLAVRILADLQLASGDPAVVVEQRPASTAADDDVERLIGQLSDAELRELLAELERQPAEQENGEVHS